MSTRVAIVGLMFLLLTACMAAPAHAGTLYTCKGPGNTTSYQDTPCPAGKTLGTGHFKSTPYAAPAVQPVDTPPTEHTPSPVAPPAPPQLLPQQPVAWICKGGPRRWLQFSPCPATYDKAAPIDVDGTTIAGEHVNGTGTVLIPVPVEAQPLDSSGACAALGDKSLRIPHRGSSDVYARNVLKSKYCGL